MTRVPKKKDAEWLGQKNIWRNKKLNSSEKKKKKKSQSIDSKAHTKPNQKNLKQEKHKETHTQAHHNHTHENYRKTDWKQPEENQTHYKQENNNNMTNPFIKKRRRKENTGSIPLKSWRKWLSIKNSIANKNAFKGEWILKLFYTFFFLLASLC